MKCPFCDDVEDKVVDSRMAKEGEVIRRRRECLSCKRRYTTYERVEETMPAVVKRMDAGAIRSKQDCLGIEEGLRKAADQHRNYRNRHRPYRKRIQDMGETESRAPPSARK